jgi:hypothetical protein
MMMYILPHTYTFYACSYHAISYFTGTCLRWYRNTVMMMNLRCSAAFVDDVVVRAVFT